MPTSAKSLEQLTSAPATTGQRRGQLLALAAGSFVLFVLVYAFTVRAAAGQRLDASALKGRGVLSRHDLHVAQRLHTSLDLASLALLGTAILLVALLRARPRLAVGTCTLIVGSLATTEILKRSLRRPKLGVVGVLGNAPTYPSGHTTIAMALAVSAIFVSPRRWRVAVAVLGSLFASVIGCSLVATASHRPGDVIGAVLVVTAWAAVVAAGLLRAGPDHTRRKPTLFRASPWMALGGIGLLVTSFVVAAISVVAFHFGRVGTVAFGHAFVAAGSAIVGAVLTCTALLLAALQDSELDTPGR